MSQLNFQPDDWDARHPARQDGRRLRRGQSFYDFVSKSLDGGFSNRMLLSHWAAHALRWLPVYDQRRGLNERMVAEPGQYRPLGSPALSATFNDDRTRAIELATAEQIEAHTRRLERMLHGEVEKPDRQPCYPFLSSQDDLRRTLRDFAVATRRNFGPHKRGRRVGSVIFIWKVDFLERLVQAVSVLRHLLFPREQTRLTSPVSEYSILHRIWFAVRDFEDLSPTGGKAWLREAFQLHFRTPLGDYPDPRWRTSDVVALARAIRDDRKPERMPILGDALMDAGCEEERFIKYCRHPQDTEPMPPTNWLTMWATYETPEPDPAHVLPSTDRPRAGGKP